MTINLASFFHANLFAVAMLLFSGVNLMAEDRDPTEPSSQITERLSLAEKSDRPADELDGLKQLRLKAIVLRDHDNGTALISLGNAESHVLRVRRSEIVSRPTELSLRGMRFRLQDFSNSSITLRRVDSDQVLIVQ